MEKGLGRLYIWIGCDSGPLDYPDDSSCGSGDYTDPAIDTMKFPGFPTNKYLWTSSSYASNASTAWYVSFDFAFVDASSYKTNAFSVLCVR